MKESVSRSAVGRRRVLQLLGFASATPGVFWAARGQAADQTAEPEQEVQQTQEASTDEPEIAEEARELGKIARRRYGEYLDDEQFEGLVEDINWNVRGAESMRKVVLTNADEPDFLFRAEP
jgi:hypothetical protein